MQRPSCIPNIRGLLIFASTHWPHWFSLSPLARVTPQSPVVEVVSQQSAKMNSICRWPHPTKPWLHETFLSRSPKILKGYQHQSKESTQIYTPKQFPPPPAEPPHFVSRATDSRPKTSHRGRSGGKSGLGPFRELQLFRVPFFSSLNAGRSLESNGKDPYVDPFAVLVPFETARGCLLFFVFPWPHGTFLGGAERLTPNCSAWSFFDVSSSGWNRQNYFYNLGI